VLDQLMDGEVAQMVFTDPPYNVRVDGHVCGLGKVKHAEFAMASGEMSEAEFEAFLKTVLSNLAAVSSDGSIHFVCMDWRHMREIRAAGDAAYDELKNLIVWNKDNGGMGTFYRSKHELIYAFKKGTGPHINNFELGQHGRYRTNVWDYQGVNSLSASRASDLAMHPTVKPVALVADAIRDCSKRNGIVLDAFSGSGTTIMAAEQTNRRGYAAEIDPGYVDVAVRRWQEQTGEAAIDQRTGMKFAQLAGIN
jgi:DNA modification methylase